MLIDYFESWPFLNTIFSGVLALIVILTVKKCYTEIRVIIMLSRFPGPKRPFIIGDMMDLIQTTDKIHLSLRKWAENHYPHYTIRLFSYMSLQIISPEDCEIFLGTKKHNSKSELYLLMQNWLREGLLLSDGKKWAKRRRILTPAFHFSVLKNFISVFNEETERVVEQISKKLTQPINVHQIGYEFALSTINETSMGHKSDAENENQDEYMQSIYEIEDVLLIRLMNPYYYYKLTWFFSLIGWQERRLLKILHNFTRKVIDERRKNFKGIPLDIQAATESDDDFVYMNKKKRRLAMLDILLQAEKDGEDIDYEGICEEVDTFMFEGHDTTGAAIGFALMLIANHPEIQEHIYNEIKSVLGDDEDRKPTYNDLQKMEYLERCIKESLRLYPSVHMISRKVDEDVVLNSGLTCPKGTIAIIHIYDVHRNPDIYPEPEKFDPDRFSLENCQHRHPYAYIPFSAGPRNCIGQKFAILEMKAFLVGILRNFKLEPIDTPETIRIKVEIILRSVDKIKVKFVPRK